MSELTDPLDDARQLVRALDRNAPLDMQGMSDWYRAKAAAPDDLWYWVRILLASDHSPLRTLQDLIDAARQSEPGRDPDELRIAARREWKTLRDHHRLSTLETAIRHRAEVLMARDAIKAQRREFRLRVTGVSSERYIENLRAENVDGNEDVVTEKVEYGEARSIVRMFPDDHPAGRSHMWGEPFAFHGFKERCGPPEKVITAIRAPDWKPEYLAAYWHPLWTKYCLDRHEVTWCVFFVRQLSDNPPVISVRGVVREEVADLVLPVLGAPRPETSPHGNLQPTVPAEQPSKAIPKSRRGPRGTPPEDRAAIVNGWLDVQHSMTQVAYCARKGISASTLRNWIREARQKP